MHTSPVRLRGHHLICLHFFSGEGYSPDFVENLSKVLKRAEAGEQIEICADADDICTACPYLKKGQCLYRDDSDEEIREMDKAAIEFLQLKSRSYISWPEIKMRLPEIFTFWAGKFCGGCGWLTVCRKNTAFAGLFDEKAESKF